MNIKNKVIVITGGASGLGRATAEYFAERGALIGVLDLNAEAGAVVVSELGEDRSIFCLTDVTSEVSVVSAIDAIMEKFGAIHGNVNCAGLPTPCKVLDRQGRATPLEKFSAVVNVNLIGLFNTMSKCVEKIALNEPDENNERGVIVNISSGAAYEGQIGQAAYSASKSGVLGINLPAARELGYLGIRVNAICPGLFATPMVSAFDKKIQDSLVDMVEAPKRMGDMREFAHCCAFLMENGYMNGRTIRLDAATILKAK